MAEYEHYELQYAAAICRLHVAESLGSAYGELRSAADGRRLDTELVRRRLSLHMLKHICKYRRANSNSALAG